MDRDRTRQIANVVAVAVTLLVNLLANLLPFGGNTTGELAGRYPVDIQPAGYAFSIWSVIYVGLVAFAIYQALPSQRANPSLRRLGYLPAPTAVFNSAWLFLWHYEQIGLSLIAMLALLGTLVASYWRLHSGGVQPSWAAVLTVLVPFSLYTGWITVASLVNVAVFLFDYDPDTWLAYRHVGNALLLGGAALAALLVGLYRADVAYAAALVWAAVAIIAANGELSLVTVGAGAVAAVAVLATLAGTARGRTVALAGTSVSTNHLPATEASHPRQPVGGPAGR